VLAASNGIRWASGAAALQIVFGFLMPSHPALRRSVLDQLEGLRDFLEVAAKDDLKLQHPPWLALISLPAQIG